MSNGWLKREELFRLCITLLVAVKRSYDHRLPIRFCEGNLILYGESVSRTMTPTFITEKNEGGEWNIYVIAMDRSATCVQIEKTTLLHTCAVEIHGRHNFVSYDQNRSWLALKVLQQTNRFLVWRRFHSFPNVLLSDSDFSGRLRMSRILAIGALKSRYQNFRSSLI